MSDIFISYAREDVAVAETLARSLEARGWSVWWDRTIPAGSAFDDVIEEALDGARCVVVLWSKASVKSDWVRNEAQEGLGKRILVPVLIERELRIPLAFRRLQAGDLVGWDGADESSSLGSLVADIARIVGAPPARPDGRRQREAARKPPRKPAAAQDLNLEDLEGHAWVDVPAGWFQMGAKDFEGARVHPVELSAFKMSRFPITNGQYQSFVNDTREPAPGHWAEGRIPEGKERHPVVHVSWTDAEAYCAWLSKRMTSQDGLVLLPTEAQWEFAARGKDGRPYPWGADEPTRERANYGGNVGDTTPVGSYSQGATPLGIHDLAGNVWEWCRDWYDPYAEGAVKDPTGPKKGASRVLRGGSFYDNAHTLRSACRIHVHPEITDVNFGFRVVWVLA